MIDIISLTGLAGSGASIYGIVSAIKSGKDIDSLMRKINTLDKKIELVNENIGVYHEDVLRDLSKIQKKVKQVKYSNKAIQEKILSPVQYELNSSILSSIPIKTPNKLQLALDVNPREVLFNVDKLEYSELHNEKSMIPVVFSENGSYYVGWQLLSAVEILFDLEFEPNKINFSIESIIEENLSLEKRDFDFLENRSKSGDAVALYDLAVIHYLNARSMDDIMYSKELLVKSSQAGYELADLRLQLLEEKISSH